MGGVDRCSKDEVRTPVRTSWPERAVRRRTAAFTWNACLLRECRGPSTSVSKVADFRGLETEASPGVQQVTANSNGLLHRSEFACWEAHRAIL